MHRVVKFLLASLSFTFLFAGSSSIAQADPVVITFTDPNQTLVAGNTGTFSGSLTNVSASPVTLSGALISLSTVVGEFEGTLIVFDFADPFLALVSPLSGGPVTLAPGESTGVIPIFTYNTSGFFGGPSTVTFTGLFTVSQGDVFIPANQLGVASWSITVLPNPNPIPEPTTAVLLGTSLLGMAAKLYRKRRG